MGHPNKAKRREQTKQWLASQRAREEADVPVSREALRALLNHLNGTLFERRGETTWCHCDHTTSRSRAFLLQLGLDADAVLRWCEEYGGCCDCEISANVGQRWEAWAAGDA